MLYSVQDLPNYKEVNELSKITGLSEHEVERRLAEVSRAIDAHSGKVLRLSLRSMAEIIKRYCEEVGEKCNLCKELLMRYALDNPVAVAMGIVENMCRDELLQTQTKHTNEVLRRMRLYEKIKYYE